MYKRQARKGLARIVTARAGLRRLPREVRPATLAGWQAAGLLQLVVAEPVRVAEGKVQLSEFARRFGLLRASLRGSAV